MKQLLMALQSQLATETSLKYIDENWGQLEYFAPNFPVQYPCALISLDAVQFSNIGKDLSRKPHARQLGEAQIGITLAMVKLTNTSQKTPALMKEQAWEIYELAKKVHQLLHGWSPLANASPLIRSSMQTIRRDDGVQEVKINYLCTLSNV